MNFDIKTDFTDYKKVFLEQNAILNLISKNEEKFLWEKHIYDSLAIKIFFNKYSPTVKKLLDIGTGGGFPSVPIALEYPAISVTALDSIRKKIRAIENIKEKLSIENLVPVCARVENIKGEKYDIVTSRAVATLDVLLGYAAPLLKNGGYFIAYKSRLADKEINDARMLIKKLGFELSEILDYRLPLEEIYERKLIVLKKVI